MIGIARLFLADPLNQARFQGTGLAPEVNAPLWSKFYPYRGPTIRDKERQNSLICSWLGPKIPSLLFNKGLKCLNTALQEFLCELAQ